MLDARERAFRPYREAGDRPGAARMALWLGDDHIEFHGEEAIANGWFGRAARILEDAAACPEHGWLAVFRAHASLLERDDAAARRLAVEARDAGRRFGDVDLEMLGLVFEGMALVAGGSVADGMRCLDEATAAAVAGEHDGSARPAGRAAACFSARSTTSRPRARSGARRRSSVSPSSAAARAGSRRWSSPAPGAPPRADAAGRRGARARPGRRGRRARRARAGAAVRLAAVEAAYDPGNVFRRNHNIAPAGG